MGDDMQRRLQLSYPCEWTYLVIGPDETDLRLAIHQIVQDRTHTVALSNTSASGKYVSLKVLVVVYNDEERTGIYYALNDHPATKVVI